MEENNQNLEISDLPQEVIEPAVIVPPSSGMSTNDLLAMVGGVVILVAGYFLVSHFWHPSETGSTDNLEQQATAASGYNKCGTYDFRVGTGKKISIKSVGQEECLFRVTVDGEYADTIDASVVEKLVGDFESSSPQIIDLAVPNSGRLVDVSLDISQRFREDGEKARATVVWQFKDWLAQKELRAGDTVVARLFGASSYEKKEYSYLRCYKVKGQYIPQNSALYVNFLSSASCEENNQQSGVSLVTSVTELWKGIDGYWREAFAADAAVESQPDLRRHLSKISDDTQAKKFAARSYAFLTPGFFKPISSPSTTLPRKFCSVGDTVNFVGLDYDDNLEIKDGQLLLLTSVFKGCEIQDTIYNNNP